MNVPSRALTTSAVESPLMNRIASPSTCETSIRPARLRTIVSSSSWRIDQLWSTSVWAPKVEQPQQREDANPGDHDHLPPRRRGPTRVIGQLEPGLEARQVVVSHQGRQGCQLFQEFGSHV